MQTNHHHHPPITTTPTENRYLFCIKHKYNVTQNIYKYEKLIESSTP